MTGKPVINRNGRVVWVKPRQQFNVGACYDKPFAICRKYANDMKHDSRFAGGILCVVSMPQGADPMQSI